MRLLVTFAMTACALGAGVDPAAIVRRSVLNDESASAGAALHYTLTERAGTRNLDDRGQLRSAASRTREMRMPDFQKRRERYRRAIREIPDAFEFRLVGEEEVNSRPAYVIEATPRPGYQPVDRYSKLFKQLRARLWIDESDYQWAKIEAELLDTVTFGWILVRVHKGSRVRLTQELVGDEAWLPREMWYRVSARIGLVSLRNLEVETEYGSYRRSDSDPAP